MPQQVPGALLGMPKPLSPATPTSANVAPPAPTPPHPKYVALGLISCYANQRTTLYTDETLTKTVYTLGPGQSVLKVGTMGEAVGLTFSSYDSVPGFWLDAKDLGSLTCVK
jgi:hypothetical protein